MLEALIAEFETIEDPRCEWKIEHKLLDILVIQGRRMRSATQDGAQAKGRISTVIAESWSSLSTYGA
jgi:hypothetical protein